MKKARFVSILLILLAPLLGFAHSQDQTELTNISLKKSTGRLEARLEVKTPINYESFTLFNPNRLIIDLLQVREYSCPAVIDVNEFGVLRIRTAKNQPDVTRVVFDLEETVPAYTIEEAADGIMVSFQQEQPAEKKAVEKPVEVKAKPPVKKIETKTKPTPPPAAEKTFTPRSPSRKREEPQIYDETGTRSKSLAISLGGGLYFAQDQDFQDIYGSNATAVGGGLTLLFPLGDREDLGVGLDVSYIFDTGLTTFTEEEVKLKLLPVSLSLFYQRHFGRILPYVGLGADYFAYQEDFPETFAVSQKSGQILGYSFLLGTHVKLTSSLSARAFFRYHVAKKTEEEREINLSGNELGIGLSFRFNL